MKRWWRHLAADRRSLKRVFPESALAEIERTIADGERCHAGELRFAVEASLPLMRLKNGQTPRERAIEMFSMLRVWDTEENCGVLIYVLYADHAVEIVADRGIDRRVGHETWQAIAEEMERAFRAGNFASGALTGVRAIGELLAAHFPAQSGDVNELPDRPVLL